MPFEFINNNSLVNEAARRRIRSHAATGRNVGKRITRPPRSQAFDLKPRAIAKPFRFNNDIGTSTGPQSDGDVRIQLQRNVVDKLSLLGLPAPVTMGEKGITQKVISLVTAPRHAPELSGALDSSSGPKMWVDLMFIDEAYFHGIMAISIMALNHLCVEQEDPRRAMKHLVHTLRLLNERLSSVNPASNANMAAVVIMSQYERTQGHYEQGLVHLQGLLRMVDLRGGIVKLARTEPGLVPKVLRADLEFALCLGSPTRFSLANVMVHSNSMLGLGDSTYSAEIINIRKYFEEPWLEQFQDDMQDLWLDSTALARLVNDAAAGRCRKISHWRLHDTLILLGYRVVHGSVLNMPGILGASLTATMQFGLMAFILTFLRGFDGRVTKSRVLQHFARYSIEGCFDYARQSQMVLLWVIFIASASVLTEADDPWLLPVLSQVSQSLNISSWDDVSGVLCNFPWTNLLHGKTAMSLWDRYSLQQQQSYF